MVKLSNLRQPAPNVPLFKSYPIFTNDILTFSKAILEAPLTKTFVVSRDLTCVLILTRVRGVRDL